VVRISTANPAATGRGSPLRMAIPSNPLSQRRLRRLPHLDHIFSQIP
jgi:hypothetical protein